MTKDRHLLKSFRKQGPCRPCIIKAGVVGCESARLPIRRETPQGTWLPFCWSGSHCCVQGLHNHLYCRSRARRWRGSPYWRSLVDNFLSQSLQSMPENSLSSADISHIDIGVHCITSSSHGLFLEITGRKSHTKNQVYPFTRYYQLKLRLS